MFWQEALVTPMGLPGDFQTAPFVAVWGGHAGFSLRLNGFRQPVRTRWAVSCIAKHSGSAVQQRCLPLHCQGFDRAVMLWSQEALSPLPRCFPASPFFLRLDPDPRQVLEAVNSEGASFFPGASGEQILVSGVDWMLMTTGVRVQIGKEATSLA